MQGFFAAVGQRGGEFLIKLARFPGDALTSGQFRFFAGGVMFSLEHVTLYRQGRAWIGDLDLGHLFHLFFGGAKGMFEMRNRIAAIPNFLLDALAIAIVEPA